MKYLIAVLLLSLSIFAAPYSGNGKVLIKKYDPVAYFTQNKAVKGDKQFTTTYDGIKIFFSSAKHKELFLSSPKKYTPKYKAWCAYALAAGAGLVNIDPKEFKKIDGKVYLFSGGFFSTALDSWNKNDEAVQIKKANAAWSKL